MHIGCATDGPLIQILESVAEVRGLVLRIIRRATQPFTGLVGGRIAFISLAVRKTATNGPPALVSSTFVRVSRTYRSWSADPDTARCVFAEARNLGSEVKCTRSRDHVRGNQIRGNEP